MTAPDKLYALQLALKECGLILTAEQVRRVLDHARDVAAVAETPMAESSVRMVYAGRDADGNPREMSVPTCGPEAWFVNTKKPCGECGAAGFNEGCTACIELARAVISSRWPAYGPGPGGQTDREGKA